MNMLVTNVYNRVMATTVGERVRELRESMGWSQGQLAFRSAVHSSHISMIERGIRVPKPKTLHKLALALGVEADELTRWHEVEPLVLHENGLAYEVALKSAPHTDPERLRLVERGVEGLSARERDELLEIVRKQLGGAEETGEL